MKNEINYFRTKTHGSNYKKFVNQSIHEQLYSAKKSQQVKVYIYENKERTFNYYPFH